MKKNFGNLAGKLFGGMMLHQVFEAHNRFLCENDDKELYEA